MTNKKHKLHQAVESKDEKRIIELAEQLRKECSPIVNVGERNDMEEGEVEDDLIPITY